MRHVDTSATGGWTRDYAYAFEDPTQPASNRLWQTWTGGDRTQAITYGYDTHGNMLNMANVSPGQHLQWDHRDMIKSLDLVGGGTAFYQYDSGKQRTRKRIESQNGLGGYWERIYLGGYERYRRYNGNGSTLVEEIESHHLFEGEQRVLLVDDVITSSKGTPHTRPDGLTVKPQTLFRYQYSNHLGSACLELDHVADIISYEEYHPYGTSAYRVMKSGIEAPAKRYRYTGMERDEESGLNYHSARYYSPWLGRWILADPIPLSDGPNSYQYATQNPIVFVDVEGRATDLPPDGGNSARSAKAAHSPIFGEKMNQYLDDYLQAVNQLRSEKGSKPLDWTKKVSHRDKDSGARAQSDEFSAAARVGLDSKGRHANTYNKTEYTAGLSSDDLSRAERRAELSGARKEHQVIIIADSNKGKDAEAMVDQTKTETRAQLKSWQENASDARSAEIRQKINTSTTTLKRILDATKNVRAKLKANAGSIGVLIAGAILTVAENASAAEAQKDADAAIETRVQDIQAHLEANPTLGALVVVNFQVGAPNEFAAQLTRFSGVVVVYASSEEEAKRQYSQMSFIQSNDWGWFLTKSDVVAGAQWIPAEAPVLIDNSRN